MNTTNEIWKDIPGYEGLYQVSNEARVKVLARTRKHRYGGEALWPEKIIKTRTNKHGQWLVDFTKDGKCKTCLLHRIVLTSFAGECPNDMEGCHNDGNKDNNCLANLRWDTHINNELDKVTHGTLLKGSAVGNSKLQDIDVLLIRSLAQVLPQSVLASIWDVSRASISLIVNRKNWAHI